MKKIILGITIFTLLLFLGCTETNSCGDGLCTITEMDTNSTSYCEKDCGTNIEGLENINQTMNDIQGQAENNEINNEEAYNPCKGGVECMRCMAYAEASGSTRKGKIPDKCQAYVMCTIKNRVGSPHHKPSVNNVCEAVSQGYGKQYNPFKCATNGSYPNQKYCACCGGKVSPPNVSTDCSNFKANTFNNSGMNSWASRNCVKIETPSACYYEGTNTKVFDFYFCSAIGNPHTLEE
jgi:hypothetical protein